MMIRKLETNDLEALAILHVTCWQESYPGLIPQSYLDSLTKEGLLEIYSRLMNMSNYYYVLEGREGLLGFVCAARRRDSDLDRMDYGEVQAIYLLKKYQGSGYGGMLLDYATAALEQSKFKYIVLWVLEANTKAIGFYKSQGFEKDGKSREREFDGIPVREIRMVKKIHHYLIDELEGD